MVKMSRQDQRKVIQLLEDRRRAGDDMMRADQDLCDLLREYGVDWSDLAYGLNSIFLITEPSVCESCGRKSIEEELGYELEE